MKKNILILLMAIVAISANAQTTGIEFETGTWQEALDKAKAEGKLLFVDVWATWCGPCKKLASDVFPQPQVSEFFNAHFVSFKMQTDIPDKATRDLYQQLAEKYGVGALPTLLWVNGDGRLEHFTVGFQTAEELLNEAHMALDPNLRKGKVADEWAAQPHTLENGLTYFQTHKEETGAFDDFFMGLTDEEKCSDRINMLLFTRVTMPADSRTLQFMAEKRDSLGAIYPTAKDWEGQLVSQVRRLLSVVPMGKEDSVTAYFDRYNIRDIKIAGDDYYCLKLFRYGKNDEAFAKARQMMADYDDTTLPFVSDLVDVTFFCATRQQAQFTPGQKREILEWAKKHVERNERQGSFHNNFMLLEAYALNGDREQATHYADMLKPKEVTEQTQGQIKMYDDILKSIDNIK